MADLIDRQALLDDISAAGDNGGMGMVVAGTLKRYVKRVPTIDPESLRPQGEWEHKKHKIFGNTYEYVCSVCGCDYALAEYDYCPNCGAKMKGAGEDA